MSVYNVLTDQAENEYHIIKFMEDDSVSLSISPLPEGCEVNIVEELGDCVTVDIKDIPNLIKALQKAQELWGCGDDN